MRGPRTHSSPVCGVGAFERNGIVHDEVNNSGNERSEEKSLESADVLQSQESMMKEEGHELENADGHDTDCHDQADPSRDDEYVLASPSFTPSPAIGRSCPIGVKTPETMPLSASAAEPARVLTSGVVDGGMGRFQVLWPHARGGLGQIYVAEDSQFHRRVALKEILPEQAENPINRDRFIIEAEITGNLEHPGIVPVYAKGKGPDGRNFYAMRFIKGEDLATAAHRFHQGHSLDFTGLEFRWLLRRFVDVCNTVAYAHSRGILHRDIKPNNIMLGSFGETLLMDWGVAKAMDRLEPVGDSATSSAAMPVQTYNSAIHPDSVNAGMTLMGQVVGTPAYMSPEQAAGDLDAMAPGSDVYSLGATLYTLLTDQSPFSGDPLTVILDVRCGLLAPPRKVLPTVPRALDAICGKAMSREPSHRYASALEMADDIELWLADAPVTAYRDPTPVRARRWVKRHQSLVAGAVATVIVMAMALGIAVPILSIARRSEAEARRAESRTTRARDPESRRGPGATTARGEGPEVPGRRLPKARSHRRRPVAQSRGLARARGQGP